MAARPLDRVKNIDLERTPQIITGGILEACMDDDAIAAGCPLALGRELPAGLVLGDGRRARNFAAI